jgi:hypothetical protein
MPIFLIWQYALPSSSMILNMNIKVEGPALESISWFNTDMNFCENIIMISFFSFFQFCDITQMANIHRKIYPNLAIKGK